MRRSWRRMGAVALVGALILVLFSAWPTGRYLLRAAWDEGRILARRRSIAELVDDPSLPAAVRGKLQLVLAARRFAVDSVRLAAGESFTTYAPLDRDTLVLVVSAAYPDRLERYTWWFPIVGRVPYKGYFDAGAARAAAQDLRRRGFDTYVRPASAFSTLGWFNDPLLSTTLREDSVGLANTVIHELTHNTFYAPGQAVFNESFANFVGAHGAEWFFRSRGEVQDAAESAERWHDELVFGRFYDGLYTAIDSAFRAHPRDASARIVARDTVYARAREQLVREVGPQLEAYPTRILPRIQLDNAVLLARRVYLTDLELFEAVDAREHHDLPRVIARVIALARARPEDPYAALRAWLRAGAQGRDATAAAPSPPALTSRGSVPAALPAGRTPDRSVAHRL